METASRGKSRQRIQPASATEETVAFSTHVVPLPGDEWKLWRWVGLRGAGFPLKEVLKLSDNACATAADLFLEHERAAEQARDRLMQFIRQELPNADPAARRLLVKAKRQLWKGQLSTVLKAGVFEDEVTSQLRATVAAVDATWSQFHQLFDSHRSNTSEMILEIASSERFQEAVLWQNRHAFHTAIVPLVKEKSGTNSTEHRHRQHESLIARYLQRYCVKNDSIGFFGPVGWATLVDEEKVMMMKPGNNLLCSRNVYFEAWGIKKLAETLTQNRALAPWFAPRLQPTVGLDGQMLFLPMKRPAKLSALQAAILHACDGERTAQEIASEIIEQPNLKVSREQEIYRHLEDFCKMGIVAWSLELPTEPYVEQILRRAINRIQDEDLRRGALAPLDQLEGARNTVACAAGNVEALDIALEQLESTFHNLADTRPTRSPGKTYAARTLVYEDCQRNIDLKIGPKMLEVLEPCLGLLLTSARWFTFEVAKLYRELFQLLYRELAQKGGSAVVDAVPFWYCAQPLFWDEHHCPISTIAQQFQARWAEVLSLSAQQEEYPHQIAYSSQDLRGRVSATFKAPGPGWQLARYHCPDIMVAASSVAAIQQDEYYFVLGELHSAMNSLGSAALVAQHPAPQALFQALEADIAEPRILLVPPKQWPGLTTRTREVLRTPRDLFLIAFNDICPPASSQALPIGSLIIQETESGLVIRTREGNVQFDIVEAFADFLSFLSLRFLSFKSLLPSWHNPRITIDRLVISRESWQLSPSQIPFVFEQDPAKRFVCARRWAHSYNMPRFIFIKTPIEPKPFYLDFASPVYIDICAKVLRQTAESNLKDQSIRMTEMLPDPYHAWLEDAEGQRYTSELRFVALDSKTCF